MKKDNSTRRLKLRLRQEALRELDAPVVLETHGGLGRLGDAVYADLEDGIVFEVEPGKAAILAQKRPTWAVYEGDCISLLAGGVGAHLCVNFLDVDPYGDPWPVLAAFFESDRPRAERLEVVVNDGLRQMVKMGGAWSADSLAGAVRRYGNGLYGQYLEVCRELMQETAAPAGYRLGGWVGYYCGADMTHYRATLSREMP